MELRKYETGTWGTCYSVVGRIEIISVTQEGVCLMVDDESCGVLDFPFDRFDVSKDYYSSLERAAEDKNLDKVNSLLSKLNPKSL
ncbi:MAG: hypothetical protein AABW51_02500 [Nanoarchaeota archaeon]